MSEIQDQVKKIVVDHLGIDDSKVIPEAKFIDDLGADSLDTVELVMAFEEKFGIEIPDDAAETIQTVQNAIDYIESKMIKLDIHVNKKKVDALSQILHKDNSYRRSRELIENLKKLIPRQNFEITIQGCIGSKIISSTSIRGYRKDVTAKLYGGDVTRKMKLLKKQKEGKKKMKKIGNVEIPREAFYKFLSTSD